VVVKSNHRLGFDRGRWSVQPVRNIPPSDGSSSSYCLYPEPREIVDLHSDSVVKLDTERRDEEIPLVVDSHSALYLVRLQA
jgi:hypothetical protein